MKKIKILTAFLLIFCTIFMICGCQKENDDETSITETEVKNPTESKDPENIPEKYETVLKIKNPQGKFMLEPSIPDGMTTLLPLTSYAKIDYETKESEIPEDSIIAEIKFEENEVIIYFNTSDFDKGLKISSEIQNDKTTYELTAEGSTVTFFGENSFGALIYSTDYFIVYNVEGKFSYSYKNDDVYISCEGTVEEKDYVEFGKVSSRFEIATGNGIAIKELTATNGDTSASIDAPFYSFVIFPKENPIKIETYDIVIPTD